MARRAEPASFELREWTVQPTLNRLSRHDESVRIEPKMMDVLVYLADCNGAVASKEQIAEQVWPDVFVSDSVITRAIAGLRRALGESAREPRFIETIPKRGYRLIATHPATDPPPAPRARPETAEGEAPARYAVGQWVRGSGFYGRTRELREVLDGPRNWLWILGNRAVGKTSVLKQLELLAAGEAPARYFPLFWDLQGTGSLEELHADFTALLQGRGAELSGLGLDLQAIAGPDLFTALRGLRRELRSRGLTLLLLCDEVEELIHLSAGSPTLLSKLRRALQSAEGIRTVMASTARLWELTAQRGDTSPFLHGFAPPLYLGALSDTASSALIRQAQTSAGRPLEDEDIAAVRRLTGNHPYLLQLVGSHLLETGELARAADFALADPSIDFFFRVDFDLLSEPERSLLTAIANSTPDGEELSGATGVHLERLGMIERQGGSRPRVRSEILGRWLAEQRG